MADRGRQRHQAAGSAFPTQARSAGALKYRRREQHNRAAVPVRGSLMDFVLDYISVNTFWTILSTTHALLAVALLGALTHQAAAVLAPPRARAAGGFVPPSRPLSRAKYTAPLLPVWGVR